MKALGVMSSPGGDHGQFVSVTEGFDSSSRGGK